MSNNFKIWISFSNADLNIKIFCCPYKNDFVWHMIINTSLNICNCENSFFTEESQDYICSGLKTKLIEVEITNTVLAAFVILYSYFVHTVVYIPLNAFPTRSFFDHIKICIYFFLWPHTCTSFLSAIQWPIFSQNAQLLSTVPSVFFK